MYTTIGFQLQPTAVAAAPNDKNRIVPNFVLSQMRHDTKNHYSCKLVGRGFKPNFFMCLVKPMPELDLSPTYLINISSLQKPEPKV
jgi:hypothetical protein